MFAIIKTGGKQYIVHPGDKIKIEKLDVAEGKEVVFSDVLLVADKDVQIGMPYVSGYKVKAKVLVQGRGKKIIVYKYKPKKRYHKKQGHRQAYTEIEILGIGKGATIKTKPVSKTTKPASTAAKPARRSGGKTTKEPATKVKLARPIGGKTTAEKPAVKSTAAKKKTAVSKTAKETKK